MVPFKLLPHPPSMTNQIFNHALKRLLLPNQSIAPFKPVLQNDGSALRDAFKLVDMLPQLCIREPVQRRVCRQTQPTDCGEI